MTTKDKKAAILIASILLISTASFTATSLAANPSMAILANSDYIQFTDHDEHDRHYHKRDKDKKKDDRDCDKGYKHNRNGDGKKHKHHQVKADI